MSLLVVGATSKVGRVLVAEALRTRPVRAATRDPSSAAAAALRALGAEVVAADLRRPETLGPALSGMKAVVASAHGFPGVAGNDPLSVDLAGHRALIAAARAARVERFLYMSVVGARPEAPVDLFAIKWRIEQELAASGIPWTCLRATAFMEFWAAMVGRPARETGRVLLFGDGHNPINFVSAGDVARLGLRLLDDAAAAGQVVELGGPEDLSMREVARRFAAAAGREVRFRRVPLAAMKALLPVARRVHRPLARQLGAGIMMDTAPMTFDPAPTLARWPMELTPLARVIAGPAA